MKKYIYLVIAIIAIFGVVVSYNVQAQEAQPIKNKILQEFANTGGTVEYLGNAYGLDGWFLVGADNKTSQYAYTTKEGATLIGALFSPDGESKTLEQLKQLRLKKGGEPQVLDEIAASSTNPEDRIYNSFANAGWLHIGDENAPYFYAIIDIETPTFFQMIEKMQSFIDNKKISIRLIPIAISEESFYKTVQIFSTENPTEILQKYMRKEEVNLPDIEQVSPEAMQKLEKNSILAQSIAIKGIPLIIYRRNQDGAINVISGVPSNALLLVSDLQKLTTTEKTE